MSYIKKSGIYKIESLANGKIYIGSAVCINRRWAAHRHMLKQDKHTNKHLQNTCNKYGFDSFVFSIVEYCPKDELITREQFWIDKLLVCDQSIGFNNSPTASTSIGFKHAEHTKQYLSDIAKQRDHTRIIQLNKSRKGEPTWNKGLTGRKWTDEEKQKHSQQRKGQAAWNKGLKHSESSKAKISQTLIDKQVNVKFTKTQRVEVIQLREQGLGYYAIAYATGISMSQCHKIYKASIGVFYKSKSPAPLGKE